MSQLVTNTQQLEQRIAELEQALALSQHKKQQAENIARELHLKLASSKKQAQQNLQELEDNVRQRTSELRDQRDFALHIMNTMAQGLAVINANERFSYVNPSYAKMLGYSPEEMIGQSPRLFMSDHGPAKMKKNSANNVHRELEQFETIFRHKNGSELFAFVTCSPRFRDDNYLGAIMVVTDLSERRRMEEQLRLNEARIRKIINTALDAVVNIDDQGLITNWNVQAEEIFGWSHDEAIGKSLTETIIPNQYRDAHIRGMRHYRATGRGPVLNQRIEITAMRKSGEEFPVELAITPIVVDDERFFSAFIRDITQRKHDEQELQQAKIAAEQAAQAKADFLAHMSHEIRTPLNAVIGLTGLLLNTDLNEVQYNYARIARNSGRALLTTLNNILDYSKIEAGKIELERTPFNLHQFLDDTIGIVESMATEKQLVIESSIRPGTMCNLKGDVARLRQVLLNLISNSIKFTAHGGVTISVFPTQSYENQSRIRFEVADTGIGIPQDRLQHLFNPFEQADRSTTRQYGGTGLGLSISQQLVQLLGGKITVTSEVSKGTTFAFEIDLQHNDKQINQTGPFTSQLANPSFALQNPLTILLVEDDAVNQLVANHMLERLGYRIDTASNGLEALQALRRQPYDIVFMDVQMPEMDGLTATKHITREWGVDRPYIVAMTANALDGDRERFLTAGMDHYISKPIMLPDIISSLEASGRISSSTLQAFSSTTFKGMDMAKYSPIDTALFRDKMGSDDPQLQNELVRIFISEVKQIWGAFEVASSNLKWEQLREIGHRWKGSSSTAAAMKFARLSQKLETSALNREVHTISEISVQLEHELSLIECWLEDHTAIHLSDE